MPQKHELEPVSTSTICWYSSIMRIYLHSFTTYKQPLQDSSSNSMLFRFFCFLRIHGTVLTMNCFKFGSLGQPALENPCFCHMANQPRSARFPGRWIFQRTRKWWIRRCKCWGILKILIWHLKNLELYQQKSWNEVQFLKRWEVVDVFWWHVVPGRMWVQVLKLAGSANVSLNSFNISR